MGANQDDRIISRKDFKGYFYLGLIYGVFVIFFSELEINFFMPLINKTLSPNLFVVIFFTMVIFVTSVRKSVKLPHLLELFVKQTLIMILMFVSISIETLLYMYTVKPKSFSEIIEKDHFFQSVDPFSAFLTLLLVQLIYILVIYIFSKRIRT